MRDYGIVIPRFWFGTTGKSLRGDPEAQVVALYLMTSPHANMIGIYHLPMAYIVNDTGCPLEGASKALRRLIEGAFCDYDEDTETVFVYRMAAHQVGDSLNKNDKRIQYIEKEVGKVQVERFYNKFIELYESVYHLRMEALASPPEAPSKPLRSPLQAPPKPRSGSGSGSGSYQDQDCEVPREARGTARAGYTEEFEAAWAAYPHRNGSNPKKAAYRAYQARIKEGKITHAEALAKVQQYRAWCQATGKIGTETVQQFASFFGPLKEGFLQEWKPPSVVPGNGNGRRQEQSYVKNAEETEAWLKARGL